MTDETQKRGPGRPRKVVDVTLPKKQPKKRGNGSGKEYMTYEAAREFVRREAIPSAAKYLDWWKLNKPYNLPAYPSRVYKNWVSWNDFLGTNNQFNVKLTWRPLEEATLWAHKLNLSSYDEWMEFIQDKSKLPSDIPARPDMTYKTWQSWSHWLGTKQRQTLEAVQQAQSIQIYYIVHQGAVPDNVYSFGVETQGAVAFRERVNRQHLRVVATFFFEKTATEQITRIVKALSSPYYDDERTRIVPNIHEVVWHLQMLLETAKV